MPFEKLSDEQIAEIQQLSDDGYTQRAIAEKLGISTGVVSKYTRGKRPATFGYSEAVVENLCERLAPMLLEKLKGEDLEKLPEEGEGKEENKREEEMSNGDVESKAQEIADRREMLQKLEKIEKLSKDMEVLKSQTGRAPEELAQQIGELKEGIDSIKNQTANFCKLYPDLCKKTEDAVAKKLEALQPKGILGTDLTLKEFHADRDSQKVLASKYLSDSGLLAALERCTDPQCKVLRQEALKRGIRIQKKREGGGMLGSNWENIDPE